MTDWLSQMIHTERPTKREAAHNRWVASQMVLERQVTRGTEYKDAKFNLRELEQEPVPTTEAAAAFHRTAIAMARLRVAMFAPLHP